MGFLDELKDRAEEFGDKAKEGFGAAKDKTEEVIENVQDRFDGDETPTEKDAAAEPVAAAVEDASTEGQKSAPSIGEAADATEPDEAAIDNATRAAPNVGDTKAGSESW
jgi:methyl-accepting chemotaxis protein